jgi:hypothetical protein
VGYRNRGVKDSAGLQYKKNMNTEKEQAIKMAINFLRNRLLGVNKNYYDAVLTAVEMYDITLEDVLEYWKKEAGNV